MTGRLKLNSFLWDWSSEQLGILSKVFLPRASQEGLWEPCRPVLDKQMEDGQIDEYLNIVASLRLNIFRGWVVHVKKVKVQKQSIFFQPISWILCDCDSSGWSKQNLALDFLLSEHELPTSEYLTVLMYQS